MKNTEFIEKDAEMLSEYSFDYTKAKPNRFAKEADTEVRAECDMSSEMDGNHFRRYQRQINTVETVKSDVGEIDKGS